MERLRKWPEKRKKIFIYVVLVIVGFFLFLNYLKSIKFSLQKVPLEAKNLFLPTLSPELKREEEKIQENLKKLFEVFQKK